jgi:hypothetical protein
MQGLELKGLDEEYPVFGDSGIAAGRKKSVLPLRQALFLLGVRIRIADWRLR